MAGIIDGAAHFLEGPHFARESFKRWPVYVKAQKKGRAGYWIEGRRYPEHEGPAAGCPPDKGLLDVEGSDPFTLDGILADMDRSGIDQSVLLPAMTVSVSSFVDAGFAEEFSRFRNEFVGRFCTKSGGRLHSVAAVPLIRIESAIQILQESKDQGHVGVLVPPTLKDRNLDHPDLEPFFAAVEELEMPVVIHGATGMHMPTLGVERFTNYIQVHSLNGPFEMMFAMTSLLEGGVLDRHPSLRVAFTEAGAGWFPYFLHRLQEHFQKRGHWIEEGWKQDPMEHLKSGQLFVTCRPTEPGLGSYLKLVGDDCVLFSSAYPHWYSEFPNSVELIRERKDLNQKQKKKILGENAKRFYGLDKLES